MIEYIGHIFARKINSKSMKKLINYFSNDNVYIYIRSNKHLLEKIREMTDVGICNNIKFWFFEKKNGKL